MRLIKFIFVVSSLLMAGLATASIDCTVDTCIYPAGTVEQSGIDIGNFSHAYSSSFPTSSPTSPLLFAKIDGTGIGSGVNCSVGNDAVIAFMPYDNEAREAIYHTLVQAASAGKTVQLAIKDDGTTCELGSVIIEP